MSPEKTSEKHAAVANPPAGGDQTFASTNDDNQNTVIKTAPWTVTIANHGQIGVVARYANEADASAAAKARQDAAVGSEKYEVKKEADLPAYLAEVEQTAL